MGEIKSTLDIIMEKTKSLSLSESEKEELRKKELANEAKGLVQKFVDGQIDTKTVKAATKSHDNNFQLINDLLTKEAIERVEPEANNEKVFELLADVLGVDSTPVRTAVTAFHNQVESKSATRLEKLREDLERQEITGSAVSPNLRNDPTWIPFYEESKRGFKEQLSLISDNRTTGVQSSGS